MLDVERRQWLVNADRRVGNQTIEESQSAGKAKCGKISVGSLAITSRGPGEFETTEFAFQTTLFRKVAAALQQLHCNQPWEANRLGVTGQPGNGGRMAAKKIDHHVGIEQHAKTPLLTALLCLFS
jgi:hypothetical protein